MADTGTSDQRYDAGVVFVHGVGNQRKGATLVQWTDVLADWLGEWLGTTGSVQTDAAGETPGSEDPDAQRWGVEAATVTDTELQPTDRSSAHCTLNLTRGHGSARRIYLAEAWWADAFTAPSFTSLAVWSLKAIPLTVVDHLVQRIRMNASRVTHPPWWHRLYHGAITLLYLVGYPIAVLILAPLAVAFQLVLLALGFLPLPRLRGAIVSVQRALTGSIGDSLILLESPAQSGSMVARTQTTIEEVVERIPSEDRLLILAHSQGVSIAHRALLERPRTGVTLITVGSGIKKLETLRMEHVDRRVRRSWASVGLLFVMGLLLVIVWGDLASGEVEPAGVFLGAGAFLLVMVVGMGLLALAAVLERTSDSDEPEVPGPGAAGAGSGPDEGQDGAGDTNDGKDRRRPWITWALIATALVLIVAVFLIIPDRYSGTVMAAFFFALAGLALLVLLAELFLQDEVKVPKVDGAEWIDMWSRLDPVPNGATRTTKKGVPRSIEVRNLDSTLRDHTYYPKNWDQCLPLISRCLANRVGFGDVFRSDLLGRFHRHRAWRVNWLIATRWLMAGAAVVAVVFRPTGIEELERVTPDPLQTLLRSIGFVTEGDNLVGIDDVLRRLLVILVLAGLAYLGAFGIWTLWGRYDRGLMFDSRPPGDSFGPVFALLLYAAGVIALAVMGTNLVAPALPGSQEPADHLFLLFWATVVPAAPLAFVFTRDSVYQRVVHGRIEPGCDGVAEDKPNDES